MKKIFLSLITVLAFNLSNAQDSVMQANNAVALETLIQSECNQQKKSSFNEKLCDASNSIKRYVINKTLTELKLPPLPEPCDGGSGNCEIDLNGSYFLRSYVIEKYLSVVVVDEKGQVINEIEKIKSSKLTNSLNVTHLSFEKPLESRGFLQIKGISEQLGGMFATNINLERFK